MTKTFIRVDALEAERDFLALIERVSAGECFEIVAEGRAVAILIPAAPAEIQWSAEGFRERVARTRAEVRATPEEIRAWIDEGKR